MHKRIDDCLEVSVGFCIITRFSWMGKSRQLGSQQELVNGLFDSQGLSTMKLPIFPTHNKPPYQWCHPKIEGRLFMENF